jgi:hypothetical protein
MTRPVRKGIGMALRMAGALLWPQGSEGNARGIAKTPKMPENSLQHHSEGRRKRKPRPSLGQRLMEKLRVI